MKTKTLLALVGALSLLTTASLAQSGSNGNGGNGNNGNGNTSNGPAGPRPQYGGPAKPADVQAMIREFERARDAFQTRQRAIEQQLKDAPAAERDRLRDQLCDQLDQFKRDQARLRDQLCDQADRQRDQLRDHTRILDRAANPTGSGPASGAGAQAGNGARGR
jgi:hypothetical protein